MGHFASNCTEVKNDAESVGSNGTEVNQINFEEFEVDESCESRDNFFNLGELENQDDVSTNQDVDSMDDIFT